MNFERGKDEATGQSLIKFRTQNQEDEAWMARLKPTGSQRLTLQQIDDLHYELRVVGEPVADELRDIMEMSRDDIETELVERGRELKDKTPIGLLRKWLHEEREKETVNVAVADA